MRGPLLVLSLLVGGCSTAAEPAAAPATAAVEWWTCPMHPEVHSDVDGTCPSCGMKLAPMRSGGAEPAADEAGDHVVHIPTERQQLIGVRVSEVREVPLHKTLLAAGTLASDETRIVEVPSPVTGEVVEVLGNSIGQSVRRGQPLVVIQGEDGARTTIKATATGQISWRVTAVGTKIPADRNVCTIYDHAGIWVWVEVYESDSAAVKVGQPATMVVPAHPGRQFEGRVTQVSPVLSPTTHTMRVRVDFANADFALKPGMSAALQIRADLGPHLAIPESAALRTGAENVVFVAAGEGRFEVRDIGLGALVGDQYVVLDGLVAGERIVTSANFLVDSESKLQGVRAAWSAAATVPPAPDPDGAPDP